MHETAGRILATGRVVLGAALFAGVAVFDGCGTHRESDAAPAERASREKPGDSGRTREIERAPRADPTVPPGKPALKPDSDPYHPAPPETVSATLYTGWKYYNADCARCHGQDATGSTIAPYLIESFRTGRVDHGEYWRIMRGSRAPNGMPSFIGSTDEDKLEAIFAYLKARSEGTMHPGRPVVTPS
jgi:mono/diheme cytochrome c family protein